MSKYVSPLEELGFGQVLDHHIHLVNVGSVLYSSVGGGCMLSSLINFSARQDNSALQNMDPQPVKAMSFYMCMLLGFYRTKDVPNISYWDFREQTRKYLTAETEGGASSRDGRGLVSSVQLSSGGWSDRS